MDKIPKCLFGILIGMAVAAVAFSLIEGAPDEQGFDHAEYPKNTIQQAAVRGRAQRWVTVTASCFGVLTCLLVVGGLSLGLSPRHQSGLAPWVLTVAAVIFASLFLLVVFLDWETDNWGTDQSTAQLWGLPLSTAIMLVVFAPSPLVLVFLYMATFPRWILPPEEEARFHDLVAKRRAEERQ